MGEHTRREPPAGTEALFDDYGDDLDLGPDPWFVTYGRWLAGYFAFTVALFSVVLVGFLLGVVS